METLFQVSGTISKVSSMAHRSLRIVLDTQENLTDEQMAKAMTWFEKLGWLTFVVDRTVKASDIITLPKLEEDNGTSPAVRYRNCLYRLWEQKGKEGDFEGYYRRVMERNIESVKEKLA